MQARPVSHPRMARGIAMAGWVASAGAVFLAPLALGGVAVALGAAAWALGDKRGGQSAMWLGLIGCLLGFLLAVAITRFGLLGNQH